MTRVTSSCALQHQSPSNCKEADLYLDSPYFHGDDLFTLFSRISRIEVRSKLNLAAEKSSCPLQQT